jgi:hypothetical protein
MLFGGTAMNAFAGGNRGWDGWVDEVAIYARVLNSNTIAAHFRAASTNNSGYHAQILADNPIGYWGLDEPVYTAPDPGTYPTAANSGSLGSAANGTNTLGMLAAQNILPYAGLESGNRACTFNGTLGNVTLPNPDALSNLVGQITLMAWVKPTAIGGLGDIISHGYDNNFVETYLRIGDAYDWEGLGEPDTAYYEVGATADGSSYNTALFPVPAGDIGNWVFLVGTWDGAYWNLYRNGQLVAQAPDTNGPVAVTNAWAIGSRGEPSDIFGMCFSGSIDEAAIFTNALSSSTVQALYESANVPPVLTQPPQLPPGQVYDGDSLTLSALAEGNPILAYQWTRNGTNLTGQNGTTLTLNPVSTNDGGTYSVIVTNNYGSATGSVFFAVARSAPVILGQPVSQERWDTFPFAFSLTATGSKPLSYQWTLSGTNLNGANASSYSGIASTTTAGGYACVLSNSYGATTTTSVAMLNVLAVPAGYVATVLADAPIAYYRLDELSGSVAHDAVGGNDGTYFNVTLGQPGYSVIDLDPAIEVSGQDSYVGNISGTAINFEGTNSSSFSLELWANGPPGQSGDAALIAKGTGPLYDSPNEQFCIDISLGNYRFFSRAAQGDGQEVPMYQALAPFGPDGAWHYIVGVYDSQANQLFLYVDATLQAANRGPIGGPLPSRQPVSFGSKRSGATAIYDLSFTGLLDEVAIYNKALSADQVAAHYRSVYPHSPPFIATQPLSVTNFVTLNASFQVDAAGTTPLSYLWTKDEVGLTDGGGISGSSTSILSITDLALTNAGGYACVVTNSLGSVTSAVANLTVLLPPTSPPAIPGLVLHLPFDDNLEDVTGRGNNGTAVGSPTFAPDGEISQALHYATGTSNNVSGNHVTEADYVTLGIRPDLQFSSNISFTVSYWVRLPPNYIGGDLPFFTDATNSTFNPGFAFAPSYGQTARTGNAAAWPGGWCLTIFDAGGFGIGVYGDIGSINDGYWHHLVHVIDRSNGTVTYLDGVRAHDTIQQGRSAAAAGNIDTGAPANIGQDPTGQYPEPGSADIDDLGVWHTALSPLEAASIYMAGLSNHLSFVGAPIILTEQRLTNQIILSWRAGMLQSSDSITGPFTNVTPVSPLNLSPTAARKFFRVQL